MKRGNLLTLRFVSCARIFWALLLFPAVAPCADLKVTFANPPGNQSASTPSATFVSWSGDRLLFAGSRHDLSSPWVAVSDLFGNPLWERTLPVKGRATFAVAASDGGVWVGAYTTADGWRDPLFPKSTRKASVPVIAKFDGGGNMQWKVELPIDGSAGLMPQCGARDGEGLIILGYKEIRAAESPTWRPVPWVSRIDSRGKVAWEAVVERDGKDLIMPRFIFENGDGCSGPLSTPDGLVTVALTTFARLPSDEGVGRPEVLVFQVTSRGEIIRRLRIAGRPLDKLTERPFDGRFPKLFQTPSGFAVFDHTRPEVKPLLGILPIVARDGGIRITRLDALLNVVDQREIRLPEFADRVDAVLPDEQGGLYLLGEPLEPHNRLLGYVNKSGVLEAKLGLGYSRSFGGLIAGPNGRGIVLFHGTYFTRPEVTHVQLQR